MRENLLFVVAKQDFDWFDVVGSCLSCTLRAARGDFRSMKRNESTIEKQRIQEALLQASENVLSRKTALVGK
jgi:hypothetical protein